MDAATTHRARRMVPWMVSAAAVLCACGSSAETPSAPQPSTALPVQTGKVERWPEASEHLSVDFDREPANAVLGAARPSGLDAFWSVASTTGAGTGFFYADSFRDSSETRVAHLPSVHRVTDIHDASAVDYSHAALLPLVQPTAPAALTSSAKSPNPMDFVFIVLTWCCPDGAQGTPFRCAGRMPSTTPRDSR